MTAIDYAYSADVQVEVLTMLRGALGPAVAFVRKASLEDDYHGTDLYYVTSRQVPIQVRMRKDRPDYAVDDDVTFRTTEPAMIAERTYAPLMAFGWMKGGRLVGGKLIDVYQMARAINPGLPERLVTRNFDGRTGFVTVTITELFESRALLRVGDRGGWANALSDADERLQGVMDAYAT